jgi:hypothetical protein
MKKKSSAGTGLPIIGWREWVGLPELQTAAIKAKIDSGARTSALHAYDIQYFNRDGTNYVGFTIHPFQRDKRTSIRTEAELAGRRWVRSSSGHRMLRPVIVTPIRLMEREWSIEITLTNRDVMGFRMLLGRQAIRRKFLVAVHRSYLAGVTRPAVPLRHREIDP